tara:strand:- start:100 stop:423 length:324 start_codon:yes stop_codon:yes gene_type:complete
MMNNSEKEAIALEYGNNVTPIVTAKGEAELAEIIIHEAKKQGIYIAEDPKLLAALAQLDIDEEIPEELFTAVAVILSWAYWLKEMEPGDEKKKDLKKKRKFKVRGQI